MSIHLAVLLLCLVAVNGQPERVKFKKVVRQSDGAYSLESDSNEFPNHKILLAVTVKNHQHSLPTFLATLESLECPNMDKKCDLWYEIHA